MTHFPKPFTPIPEQVEILKGRGMSFSDEDKAQRCLARVGYYRLSAYWFPFREVVGGVTQDDFIAGTSFDEVFEFYVFDKDLRMLVSDALERIEIALRAQIAHQLGPRDKWAHRNASELHGDFATKPSKRNAALTRHADWLQDQDRKFHRSREDFAKHFRSKYTGNPPIWIATEVWDWGMLSHFYDGLKNKDKDAVASFYGNLSGKEMVTWIRSMNNVRNLCAHHSRLWNRGLPATLSLPRAGRVPEVDHLIGHERSKSRIYGVLVIMALMMKAIHPDTRWHHRVIELAKRSPAHPLIDLYKAGFLPGWEAEVVWTS